MQEEDCQYYADGSWADVLKEGSQHFVKVSFITLAFIKFMSL